MDNSIPGPSKPCSSQSAVKRSNPRTPKQSNAKSQKRRVTDRTVSDVTIDNDDLYNCHLSAKTKETVLKLKKISDPFDKDLQDVVDDVFEHFDQNVGGDVDLAESALLLSGVTQVYSTQVKTLFDEVLAIANRLSGKEVIQRKGRKKNAEPESAENDKKEENGEATKDGETTKEGESSVNPENPDSDKVENTNDQPAPDQQVTDENSAGTSSEEHSNNGASDEGTPPSDESAAVDAETSKEDSQPENQDESNKPADDAAQPSETNIEDVKKLESEILNEIPGRCTRRQSERLKNILNLEKEKERDYKLKKRKFDDDPPELISCIDEWKKILEQMKMIGDIDVDEILPPVLELQVGRKKKKMTINNNEINDDCETCHADAGESCQETPEDKLQSALSLAMSSGLNSQQYETLDHLSNDVQERFHALIQEMHKLPFDYGLMQRDMFEVYQQKFLQAVSLLSQNSVLVKRSESDLPEKDAVATVMEMHDSQMSESDQALSSVAELLSQVRKQAAEDYNKGKQSKSDAEVPISQMIATLKRIICSRYKKYHVRTDGDKAVFKRIKEFEDRVKAVLKREAEQGLFDVRKYEMEVMDVTLKESQDGDGDDMLCPLSPVLPPDGAESPRPADDRNWALASSSRRSSVAGSIDGSSSWIRLYDIFSHMKKIDNSETCRHFYAVLALLSHKNLNINYDTLFSKESAKLISKLLKTRNDNPLEKYPVGAKIMTSRCPDVDRDEVFLAPAFNSETIQQVLEQDGYLSSSGYQSDGQGSSSTSGNGNGFSFINTKTIQDAISEFVIDPGDTFPEDLFAPKRARKH